MSEDFWSRRRAAVEAEAQDDKRVAEQAVLAEEHAALEEQSDEEILKALNLPDPDSLKSGDDFRMFMAKAVPDRIRRRALRTLWKSNPVLANVDSLVDYGEDFTDSSTVVENLQTAYQVGKGMLKHVEEMARQAAEEETQEVAPVAEREEEKLVVAVTEAPEIAEETPPQDTAPEPEIAPMPRRMKFRIEETA